VQARVRRELVAHQEAGLLESGRFRDKSSIHWRFTPAGLARLQELPPTLCTRPESHLASHAAPSRESPLLARASADVPDLEDGCEHERWPPRAEGVDERVGCGGLLWRKRIG
jgi:hypothetical protein